MNFKFIKGHDGFTLMEILVALTLITVVLSLVKFATESERDQIDNNFSKLERAIRFASDEAILKNNITRIHFLIDKNPAEYIVESGPSNSFMLPPANEEKKSKSLEEQAKANKEEDQINKSFNTIRDYEDSQFKFDGNVRLVGVGTSLSPSLQTEGQYSLYMYPTGEKESAVIIMGSHEEVAALAVDAFSGEIEKVYKKLENVTKENLLEVQAKAAEDLFKEWKK